MYSTSIGSVDLGVGGVGERARRGAPDRRRPARCEVGDEHVAVASPPRRRSRRSPAARGRCRRAGRWRRPRRRSAADGRQHDRRATAEAADLDDPPARRGSAAAAAYSRRPWSSVIHPSTSAASASASSIVVIGSLSLAHRTYTARPNTTTHATPSSCSTRSLSEDLLRRRAAALLEHERVAQQGGEHRHDRQLVERPVGRRLVAALERPLAVAEQRRPARHGEHEAQVAEAVGGERRPHRRRVLADLAHLGVALAGDDEQRAEHGDEHEPVRHRHVDGDGAAGGPQHEARRDGDDVEHGDVLEPQAVEPSARRCRRRRRRRSASARSARRRRGRRSAAAMPTTLAVRDGHDRRRRPGGGASSGGARSASTSRASFHR